MANFVGLKTITYSYLIDDGSENKKCVIKKERKCVIKKNLNLKIIKTAWKQLNLNNLK